MIRILIDFVGISWILGFQQIQQKLAGFWILVDLVGIGWILGFQQISWILEVLVDLVEISWILEVLAGNRKLVGVYRVEQEVEQINKL